MKELFAEHGIPEFLCAGNDPQTENALFVEFATDWKFGHNTCSPRNPRSNGQAEADVKIVIGFLTHTKFSGQEPNLALLVYHNTPIDAHLFSPANLLYKQAFFTLIPEFIQNLDLHAAADHDCHGECASQSAAYHEH